MPVLKWEGRVTALTVVAGERSSENLLGKGLGRAPGTTPKAKHRQNGWEQAIQQDYVAEAILERLRDLENHPQESLTPYEEFEESGEFYYFTPGGFLYRKDAGTEGLGGFFCGYLSDEMWHHRTDDG